MSLAADAILEAFSLEVEEHEGGVRISMPRTDITVGGVRNGINGGVLAALIEVSGHLALGPRLEAGARIESTLELGLSYLSAARGERTVAEARVLRVGGRLAVCAVEVSDASTGTLNAVGRVTLALARDAAS